MTAKKTPFGRISILLSLFSGTTTNGFVLSPLPITTTAPVCPSFKYGTLFDSPFHYPVSSTTTVRDSLTTLMAKSNKSDDDEDEKGTTKTTKRVIANLVDLDACWNEYDEGERTSSVASTLSVIGDTQILGSPDHPDLIHPVVRVLHERKRKQASTTINVAAVEDDKNKTEGGEIVEQPQKIALVIEGGGMRGCVTGGMVCAIDYLGLRDCVDVVYGSSAGSIIGAYFVTGQLPWFGPEVYYDQLTTAGKSFIDTGRLLRALGIGLLNPKLIKDVITRRNAGKPILDLDYLLEEIMQKRKPLDWTTFVQRQEENIQPLKIVASGMKSEQPLVMNYKEGHFKSLEELAKCMHGSSLLPGVAGPVVNILKKDSDGSKPKFVFHNNLNDGDYEPLADALIYAPIPYAVAQKEGATHIIVLRSKPDGGDVIGNGGSVVEKLIWSRFFLRKNKLPNIYRRLRRQLHKRLYAKNILELNEASTIDQGGNSFSSLPPTLTVGLPPGIEEIGRLETDRAAIFEGVRQGFARAYDVLVEDPNERGKGYDKAKLYFPEEILDYSPQEIQQQQQRADNNLSTTENDEYSYTHTSAFVTYLSRTGIWPKGWKGLTKPPIGFSSRKPITIVSDEPNC